MDESPDAVFDITELTSMLLIPHLRKTVAEDDARYLFGSVLKMIALDVNGSTAPMHRRSSPNEEDYVHVR
jgi:hypothetical protein